jgi:hypothetical protein
MYTIQYSYEKKLTSFLCEKKKIMYKKYLYHLLFLPK